MPASIPSLSPSPTPAPTPTPRLGNPIDEYLQAYDALYAPMLSAMDAVCWQEPQYISCALDARKHMQRLQIVLQPLVSLTPGTGEESDYTTAGNAANETATPENTALPNTWDGPLMGQISGTGVITGTYTEATFSCTLTDGNQITGELQDGELYGLLEESIAITIPVPDETDVTGETDATVETTISYNTVCEVRLQQLEDGYLSTVAYLDACSALFITAEKVYYMEGDALPAEDALPENWALWRFSENEFMMFDRIPPEGEVENAE